MEILARKTGLILSEQILDKININDHHKGERLRTIQRQFDASPRVESDIKAFAYDFLTQILGYQKAKLIRTPTLEKHGVFLEETMSAEKPDMIYKGSKQTILIITVAADSLDAKEERTNRYKIGYFTKFERFMRKSDVQYGWMTNGQQLRFIYAGEGLTTAWLEWDVDDLEQMEDQLNLVVELFQDKRLTAKKDDLFSLIQQSQDEAGELTDKLSAQVLQALRLMVGTVQPEQATDLKKTYQTLVRAIMRMIFLLYAEETGIFPHGDPVYDENYGIIYLANELMDAKRRGNEQRLTGYDSWYRLLALFNLVYYGSTHPQLTVVAHGGVLFDPVATQELEGLNMDNATLREIFNQLLVIDGSRVTYRSLEVEQIGFIYEDLLNYDLTRTDGAIQLHESMERKSTGSYYTRPELVSYVVEKTLEPLTEKATSQAILQLKICDPAMGSGAFLVKTLRYLSKKLTEAWSSEGKRNNQSTEDLEKEAKRLISQNCLYGVDINPMAVELSKISLWLETLSADRSFTFLDHHLRTGNSLIGVWGDEKITTLNGEIYKYSKKNTSPEYINAVKEKETQNKIERPGQMQIFAPAFDQNAITRESLDILKNAKTDSDYTTLEALYKRFKDDPARLKEKLKRDIYLASWFANEYDNILPLTTTELMEQYAACDKGEITEFIAFAQKVAWQQQFFHWDLEFPEVFERGGFDAVVGNPPWEAWKIKEREYFQGVNPDIANTKKTDVRRRKIEKLSQSDPQLYSQFKKTVLIYERVGKLWKESRFFNNTAKGEINLYAIFSEQFKNLTIKRAGMVVPTGLFTDKGTSEFFASLVDQKHIAEINDFENRKGLFGNVHRSYRFSLFIVGQAENVKMRISLTSPQQLFRDNAITLMPSEISMFNPNTKTLPMVKTGKDLQILKKIYSQSKIIFDENASTEVEKNPLGCSVFRLFDMSNDSDKFRRRSDLESEGYTYKNGNYIKEDTKYLPLYEGKSFYIMDSRYNRIEEDGNGYPVTEEEKSDPEYFPKCRYYVSERDFNEQLERKNTNQKAKFWIGFRQQARSDDSRTMIISPIIKGPTGNSIYTVTVDQDFLPLLLLSTHIIDFILRCKVQGANINKFIFNQLPVLSPEKLKQTPGLHGDETIEQTIRQLLINLTNYAYDLEPFVKELGGQITPRPWDERERLRNFAKLDAIVAHLYGLTKDELKHIFADFKGEAKNQKDRHGEYLSQRLAFEYYEDFARISANSNKQTSGEKIGSVFNEYES
jgi:hypothetical protein